MSIQGLFGQIQRRRLPHWLVVYAAAAWGAQRLLDVVLFLLLVFVFVVVVLVWYHGEKGLSAQRGWRGP